MAIPSFYSDPPPLRDFKYDKPTLLVCWWVTIFCSVMILFRVAGRFIRTERLFREDHIAAAAIVPLFLRMGCIHYILVHGTNNVDLSGTHLSREQIHRKRIASGLVLLSRFFFTLILWIFKFAILEFLNRLTGVTWESIHHQALAAIRWTLLLSFVGVLISDLAECQPFDHFWQVEPTPAGQCRQGFVWLVVMGTFNALTDMMLVIFPLVIVLKSRMRVFKKIQLVFLFSLGLSVVGVTLYRIPHVFWAHGRQQTRSLLASVEILFATTAANALVLGSFVRDRGLKKQKFHRNHSAAETFDSRTNRPAGGAINRQWGSDEDLVRDMGMTLDPELQETRPLSPSSVGHYRTASVVSRLPGGRPSYGRSTTSNSIDRPIGSISTASGARNTSFFDVGGLLEENIDQSRVRDFGDSSGGGSSSSGGGGVKSGGGDSGAGESSISGSTLRNTSAFESAPIPVPSPTQTHNAGGYGFRRGSQALLQDLGGFLASSPPNFSPRFGSRPTNGNDVELMPRSPKHNENKRHEARLSEGPELMDMGGLLK